MTSAMMSEHPATEQVRGSMQVLVQQVYLRLSFGRTASTARMPNATTREMPWINTSMTETLEATR
jgi:hypothetical protein